MKVQILLNGEVANTQLISIESMLAQPSLQEVKRIALKRAIEDRAVSISQSLQVSFRLFDVAGKPIDESDYDE